MVQDTYSVGLRYELLQNASLKLQYEHQNINSDDAGSISFAKDGIDSINITSVVFDIVF